MYNAWPTAFTAGTTRVSNPVCSPSRRPSPSDPSSQDAFATGGPPEIIAFYRSLRNTSCAFRSLVKQSPLHAVALSATISQGIYLTGYGRFRPSKRGRHSERRYYRGGWHRSYPLLIRQGTCPWQKPVHYTSTGGHLITQLRIVKVSRLLHPVGLGPVSQCPSPGSPSQGPYGS
ncbi:MAG: hypothetical protein PWP03_52 [Candidatus Woesearchaeota archaeon]|nr:hypothetical protein [Candidatus Woesearchaeota archaeon]